MEPSADDSRDRTPYRIDHLRETWVVAESTRRTMQANRSRDTGLELTLRRALWTAGVRGYRLYRKDLPGKPDLVFGRSRLCVFVHGCFWHGCERCGRFRLPKTNEAFWSAKIARNRQRDAEVRERLEALGYRVLVLRECELREDLAVCVLRVRTAKTLFPTPPLPE